MLRATAVRRTLVVAVAPAGSAGRASAAAVSTSSWTMRAAAAAASSSRSGGAAAVAASVRRLCAAAESAPSSGGSAAVAAAEQQQQAASAAQLASLDARTRRLVGAERWSEVADVARVGLVAAEAAGSSAIAFRLRSRLAFALLQNFDYSGAVAEYETLLGGEWVAGADDDESRTRELRARALSNFSLALAHVGDADRALSTAADAVEEVCEAGGGEDPADAVPRVGLEGVAAGVLCNYSALLCEAGSGGKKGGDRSFEAQNVAQNALTQATAAFGHESEYTKACLHAVAYAAAAHGGQPQIGAVVGEWLDEAEAQRTAIHNDARQAFDSDSHAASIRDMLPELEKHWAKTPTGKFDPPGIVIPAELSLPAFADYRRKQQA